MDRSRFSIFAPLKKGLAIGAHSSLRWSLLDDCFDDIDKRSHNSMARPIAQSTVEVFEPSRLAASQKWRLLQALQDFANLRDDPAGLEKFRLKHPSLDFRPMDCIDQGTGTAAQMDQLHVVVIQYRDVLRQVWSRQVNGSDFFLAPYTPLAFLLGLDPYAHSALGRGTPDSSIHPPPVTRVREAIQDKFTAFPSRLIPDWDRGQFHYSPQTDFQRAVYLLFLENWRAKQCAHCSAFFVADKPPQLYCGISCSTEVKRKRALVWWRTKGSARRNQANEAENHKLRATARKGG
jgi:hypothetical protein